MTESGEACRGGRACWMFVGVCALVVAVRIPQWIEGPRRPISSSDGIASAVVSAGTFAGLKAGDPTRIRNQLQRRDRFALLIGPRPRTSADERANAILLLSFVLLPHVLVEPRAADVAVRLRHASIPSGRHVAHVVRISSDVQLVRFSK
jgi:hypothetical protein